MKTDLNKFVEWSKENPGSVVYIEIGGSRPRVAGKITKIHVFDFNELEGQFVKSVDEIDIRGTKRKRMERQKTEAEDFLEDKKRRGTK